MKKLTLTVILVIAILLFIQSFVSSRQAFHNNATKETANAIECPAVPIEDAVLFNPAADTVMRMRRNIDSLTPAQLESLKRGIARMKALPYTDPTSWAYQAAIHGTLRKQHLPGWNSCIHDDENDKFFFLAWHRMFLYFFERILRDKSGDPTLTLPYWDYETKPVLPAAFRLKAAKNPLYEKDRNPAINAGASIDPNYSIKKELQRILQDKSEAFANYGHFQEELNHPHGSVHMAIGGLMGQIETAGQDPVFWVHHCNIDRLWGEWLKDHCRHKNSKFGDKQDKAWLNKESTFFDEKGRPVKLKGEQVIYSYDLKYLYDTDPGAGSGEEIDCGSADSHLVFGAPVSLMKTNGPVQVDGFQKRIAFAGESTRELKAQLASRYTTPFNFKVEQTFNGQNPVKQDKLLLRFHDIKVTKLPEGIVAVYLNLPAGQKPDAGSKYFAGLLDLFSGTAGHGDQKGYNKTIDISDAAWMQELSPADLEKATITLLVNSYTNSYAYRQAAKLTMRVGNIALLLRVKDQPETE